MKGGPLPDANVTIQVGEGQWRKLLPSTYTANRVVTLGTTGASEGHFIFIERSDASSNLMSVVNGGSGGGTIFSVSGKYGLICRYDGVNWAVWTRTIT